MKKNHLIAFYSIIFGGVFVQDVVTMPVYEHLDKSLLANSDESYHTLVKIAKKNTCFMKTVEKLMHSCRTMGDEEQSRFALKLTNCHLEKSGKPVFECKESDNFKDCTKKMVGDAWNAYTSFFTHADNVCFYYKSIIWYEESEKMINQLTYYTTVISNIITENFEKTKAIYELYTEMDKTLKNVNKTNQETMQKLNETSSQVDKLQGKLNSAISSLLQSVEDQKNQILSFFERFSKDLDSIKRVIDYLLYESFNITGVLFYLFTYGAIAFLTTHHKLQNASFNSKLTIIANFMIEKIIHAVIKGIIGDRDLQARNILFYNVIFYERTLMIIVCAKILYNAAENYKPLDERFKEHMSSLKLQSPQVKAKIKDQLCQIFQGSLQKKILKARKKMKNDLKSILEDPNHTESVRSSMTSVVGVSSSNFESAKKSYQPESVKRNLQFD